MYVQMVDMVLWNDDDEDWLYEKILLGGILKKVDDDNGPRTRYWEGD